MTYTAEDVVGFLDGDSSFIDSSDDDLEFEIDEIDDYDNTHFHAQSQQGI